MGEMINLTAEDGQQALRLIKPRRAASPGAPWVVIQEIFGVNTTTIKSVTDSLSPREGYLFDRAPRSSIRVERGGFESGYQQAGPSSAGPRRCAAKPVDRRRPSRTCAPAVKEAQESRASRSGWSATASAAPWRGWPRRASTAGGGAAIVYLRPGRASPTRRPRSRSAR